MQEVTQPSESDDDEMEEVTPRSESANDEMEEVTQPSESDDDETQEVTQPSESDNDKKQEVTLPSESDDNEEYTGEEEEDFRGTETNYRNYSHRFDGQRKTEAFPGMSCDPMTLKWTCNICKQFNADANSPWVKEGVSLHTNPARKQTKHFRSKIHRKAQENKDKFERQRSKDRSSQISKMFGEQQGRMKKAFKDCFKIIHFMSKKHIANHNYKPMLELLSQCNAVEIKEFLRSAPKNASYTSLRNQRCT